MKPTLLCCMALLASACGWAQFSLLPQIGFERSSTSLVANSFSGAHVTTQLRASLKADLRFKGGHGPFINVGTAPAPVGFLFHNDSTLVAAKPEKAGNLQLRMEAGYQYTSKPIRLGKGSTVTVAKPSANKTYTYGQRKSCGSNYYRPSCGDKKVVAKQSAAKKAWNMQLQPSLALAYLSGNNPTLVRHADGYRYYADAWNTALVPAMGVSFGKGQHQLFTLTVFYTRPLDMAPEEVTSVSGGKPVVTAMNPKASAWGMTLGVPISLGKKTVAKFRMQPSLQQKTAPQQFYYRKCTRTARL